MPRAIAISFLLFSRLNPVLSQDRIVLAQRAFIASIKPALDALRVENVIAAAGQSHHILTLSNRIDADGAFLIYSFNLLQREVDVHDVTVFDLGQLEFNALPLLQMAEHRLEMYQYDYDQRN